MDATSKAGRGPGGQQKSDEEKPKVSPDELANLFMKMWGIHKQERINVVDDGVISSSITTPIDSAEHLFESVMMDEMPKYRQTLDDFGFTCFEDWSNRSNLLGVYGGLMDPVRLGVPAKTVGKWLEEKTLHQNIVAQYERVEGFKGEYYPWFLKHRHVIENGRNGKAQRADFAKKLEPFLDPEDRRVDGQDCKPKEKREGYTMFVLALKHNKPKPAQLEWLRFGFCTTVNTDHERRLGSLYEQLVPKCRFTEFWKAHEERKLIDLMDCKGLKTERQQFTDLETFLSTDAYKESVWHLVQFCRTNDLKPPTSVAVDYGFAECTSARQRVQLKAVYQELLEKHCEGKLMELHGACVQGKLVEFVERYMKVDEGMKKLMVNPYPLEGGEL